MVLGARIAGGCTSGHGISGTLQLAVQSWTFIVLAFAAAVATAFLLFGKEGRRPCLKSNPAVDLALGLLTGIAFGFLLQKGRVAKYQTILGQLLLKDWTTFKIMITAILTGSVGVYFLIERGAATLDIWPFQPAAMLIGAVLFGVGLAVLGYCPGTGMAGAGEGSRDAMVGVLGMITGAGFLVIGYNILEPVALVVR